VVEHFRIPFVIGAGSGGCKIASGIAVPGIAKVAINSSWKDLNLLPDDVVKVRAGGGKGSGMDPKMGEKHYKAARDEVRRTLMDVVERCGYAAEDVSMIPVIVSTGFGFGSGSGPWIVRDLKKWFPKAVVLAFATTPFPFEGEETLRRSYESCRRMAEEVGVILMDNGYVASLVGAGESLWQALDKVNKYVSTIINTFLRIASTRSILAGIDETDLRRVAGRGLIYMFTRSFTSEAEGLEKLYDSDSMLAKYEFAKPEPLPVEMIAFIQSPKAPSITMIDRIRGLAEERLGISARSFKVGIFSGERLSISVLIGGLRWWTGG